MRPSTRHGLAIGKSQARYVGRPADRRLEPITRHIYDVQSRGSPVERIRGHCAAGFPVSGRRCGPLGPGTHGQELADPPMISSINSITLCFLCAFVDSQLASPQPLPLATDSAANEASLLPTRGVRRILGGRLREATGGLSPQQILLWYHLTTAKLPRRIFPTARYTLLLQPWLLRRHAANAVWSTPCVRSQTLSSPRCPYCVSSGVLSGELSGL
ncbi:hypothetical protein BDY21DRAFT_173744 [Lineolata rhizophorae]|uniref:Uncharacterized protein n=1 Tax=Lineolata rhizophorae TaxID=578093 RepID=A0A6A6NM36_9PEZI|nr:hypothetical protein BDY21DRAFT_173744 [Lineolata rhizophorae]